MSDPPGLPEKYTWVVFLMPATVLALIVLGFFVPIKDWMVPLIGFALPAAIVIYVAVRYSNQRRAALGLVPKREGYSAQVELLAAKLRERARELEEEPDAGLPFELQEYMNEVRHTAIDIDKHEFLPRLDLTRSLLDDADVRHHVEELRDAARECDRYAADVRRRGGIYRAEPHQLAGCAAILVVMAAAGVWMGVTRGWWIGGIALVALAAVLTWAMIGSQRDPA